MSAEGMQFERSIDVPVPVRSLWDWHAAPGAFERLMPPWRRLGPVHLPDGLSESDAPVFKIRMGPFARTWRARHEEVQCPGHFVDRQEAGPFRFWRHEHRFEALSETRSRLTDCVHYSLPMGLERFRWARLWAERELVRLFAFRHARMLADMERGVANLPGAGRIVLVTGSSGLVGQRLLPYLRTRGYMIRGLTRQPRQPHEYTWNPATGEVDPGALEGVDAVIHLAGENIASGRWTRARKSRILDSRVQGTRTLVEAMAARSDRPRVLVSASGVSPGFLGEVCQQWEAEAFRAERSGIRTVCMRMGAVLDPLGGALARMLPAFRMGIGGPLGSGRQRFPWIAMDDLLDLYVAAMEDDTLHGPLTAVHPHQPAQAEFAQCLGSVLRRPAFLPVPALVIRTLLGQMGEEILLADVPAYPDEWTARGHRFRQDSLEAALRFMLGRQHP